jgi:hypothetical protein
MVVQETCTQGARERLMKHPGVRSHRLAYFYAGNQSAMTIIGEISS